MEDENEKNAPASQDFGSIVVGVLLTQLLKAALAQIIWNGIITDVMRKSDIRLHRVSLLEAWGLAVFASGVQM